MKKSNKTEIVMKLRVLVFGLLLVGLAACGSSTNPPTPKVTNPPKQNPIVGTWYECNASGKLIFESIGSVVLTAGESSFSGTWTFTGNNLFIKVPTASGMVTFTFTVSSNKDTLNWTQTDYAGRVKKNNPPVPFKKDKSAC